MQHAIRTEVGARRLRGPAEVKAAKNKYAVSPRPCLAMLSVAGIRVVRALLATVVCLYLLVAAAAAAAAEDSLSGRSRYDERCKGSPVRDVLV